MGITGLNTNVILSEVEGSVILSLSKDPRIILTEELLNEDCCKRSV